MKNRKNIIRFLASLSMLIFFSPFFQMCSDKHIKESSSFIKSCHKAETAKEKEIAFERAKKDFSLAPIPALVIIHSKCCANSGFALFYT
ncbi:hypothetical protein [Flavobacterium salmonis]|uniref:hypothetical protein n=1 Tax=Flavobacterium salmonis TaxID=2654844 RepID=UPI0015DDE268|nr:hypothetical protein [Flavobacterium salmonis]